MYANINIHKYLNKKKGMNLIENKNTYNNNFLKKYLNNSNRY